jgi:hypothetical protein
MLERVPCDVLRLIIFKLTNIDDLQALSRTSRHLKAFVCKRTKDVAVHLTAPYQISLKFLPMVEGLRFLQLNRTYSMKLDLGILEKCGGLQNLLINSTYRIINAPSRICIQQDACLGKMLRIPKGRSSQNDKNEENCHNKPLTPKEYFQSRYNTRYGKYGSKKFSHSI